MLREAEKYEKDAARREREQKQKELAEAKRRRQEELQRQRMEENLKRQQEKEAKRQQAALLKEQVILTIKLGLMGASLGMNFNKPFSSSFFPPSTFLSKNQLLDFVVRFRRDRRDGRSVHGDHELPSGSGTLLRAFYKS